MRKLFTPVLLLFLLTSCQEEAIIYPTTDCYWRDLNIDHPENIRYQSMLDDLVADSLPGISCLIAKANDNLWVDASGVARIETGLALEPCHIMPIGAVSTLYTATAAKLMEEESLFSLDDPIDQYLPESIINKIPQADKISIRHLLNHSSGLPDFQDHPNFFFDFVNNKSLDFGREAILEKYVYGSKSLFEPGSGYHYSNTNYELLTMIMDQVYPKGHASFYTFRILSRLGLEKTYYKEETRYNDLYNRGMANGYIAQSKEGTLVNATDLSLSIASGLTGSDGVLSNVLDLYTFFKSIIDGDIVDRESVAPLRSIEFGKFGKAIGLSGQHPGYTTELWYLLDQQTYIVCQMNVGESLLALSESKPNYQVVEKILATVLD